MQQLVDRCAACVGVVSVDCIGCPIFASSTTIQKVVPAPAVAKTTTITAVKGGVAGASVVAAVAGAELRTEIENPIQSPVLKEHSYESGKAMEPPGKEAHRVELKHEMKKELKNEQKQECGCGCCGGWGWGGCGCGCGCC